MMEEDLSPEWPHSEKSENYKTLFFKKEVGFSPTDPMYSEKRQPTTNVKVGIMTKVT